MNNLVFIKAELKQLVYVWKEDPLWAQRVILKVPVKGVNRGKVVGDLGQLLDMWQAPALLPKCHSLGRCFHLFRERLLGY